MSLRLGRLGLLVAGALASPVLAGAQPVAIEHQDVACIVAGQFPVLDACFRPGPGLAQARVYFRPEGVTTWYYVNAAGPAPPKVGDPADLTCRRTTLPKPKKSLIEKHIEYYVDATGRKQESSQTEVFKPLVVKSEDECKKKLVAPFVPNAVVQVFPSLPAAFALGGGGLSGIGVAAVVGAGVAATTTVVALTSGGDSSPSTTTAPVTTLPTVTVPTTTATTTLPPATAFNPVFKVFKAGVLQPDKIAGTEPVQLRFFMCESTGPLPLKYNVFVNGGVATAGCDTTITFTTGGFAPGFGGVSTKGLPPPTPSAASYNVVMQIQSDGPGNNPKSSRLLTVDVTGTAPPTTTTSTTVPTTTTTTTSTTTTVPTTTTTTSSTTTTTTSTTTTSTLIPLCQPGNSLSPAVTLLSPAAFSIYHPTLGNYPVPLRANVTDASAIAHVEYQMDVTAFLPSGAGAPGIYVIHNQTPGLGDPNPYDWTLLEVQTLLPGADCQADGFLVAVVTDACGNVRTERATAPFSVRDTPCSPTVSLVPAFQSRPGTEARVPSPEQRPVTWVSQLDVPGGRGQIVVNGSEALFPAAGRVPLSARTRTGENRVEAQLVQADGRAGLWRFELPAGSTVPGSLRVIAGQVALVTGDAVVFRLKGQPGERVVFTFRNR